jgi:curli biogenesis system outer membrane secretion channel CsgG
MLHKRFVVSVCFLVAFSTLHSAAQNRVRIGLIPFDVTNVDGGTFTAANALAKLVRAQMITDKRTQPVLLELPAGAKLPLSQQQLAALIAENDVELIVAGTVLEAKTTHGSNRVSTGGFGGAIGGAVGGSVTRTRAEVTMHVELVGKDGDVHDTFPIEESNTDVGVGADIWTALGSFDAGDTGWEKSPMGKALREAAEKLASEVMKRKAKAGAL